LDDPGKLAPETAKDFPSLADVSLADAGTGIDKAVVAG
jgi:hypothetical protein